MAPIMLQSSGLMADSRLLSAASLLLLCLPLAASSAVGPGRGAPWDLHVIDGSSRGADGVRLGDVNGDGLADVATGWEQGDVTRVYAHPGHAKAKATWPAVAVGEAPSVEDAVFVDLDEDGATDVVSCCEGSAEAIFVHWAPEDMGRRMEADQWRQAPLPASRGRMKWMFAAPMQVDSHHGVDLIAGGKGEGAQIGWFEAPREPRRLEDWAWRPLGEAGWIMSIVPEDMDGDGDLDILVSDRKGPLRGCRWLENPGAAEARRSTWRNRFIGGQDQEAMFLRTADLDGDGLRDVLVAVREAGILWFRRLDKAGTSWEEQKIPFPGNTGTPKAVAAGDLDGDGDMDLVISCEHAAPPKSGLVWLSRSSGTWRAREISGPRGIKFDRIELIDLDGDGDLDALTTEESDNGKGLGVIWYENPRVPAPAGRAPLSLTEMP
jgi:hypothetical protein